MHLMQFLMPIIIMADGTVGKCLWSLEMKAWWPEFKSTKPLLRESGDPHFLNS